MCIVLQCIIDNKNHLEHMCHKIISKRRNCTYKFQCNISRMSFVEAISHEHKKNCKLCFIDRKEDNCTRKQNCEIYIIRQIKYSTLKPCIQLVT